MVAQKLKRAALRTHTSGAFTEMDPSLHSQAPTYLSFCTIAGRAPATVRSSAERPTAEPWEMSTLYFEAASSIPRLMAAVRYSGSKTRAVKRITSSSLSDVTKTSKSSTVMKTPASNHGQSA
mmetsp:Transcript_27059/g.68205  ORF Transcript_27059/g.68205 Transcript_27059/m.68205 type:complete len:122 (+) Transcript_27059:1410-1775(+)